MCGLNLYTYGPGHVWIMISRLTLPSGIASPRSEGCTTRKKYLDLYTYEPVPITTCRLTPPSGVASPKSEGCTTRKKYMRAPRAIIKRPSTMNDQPQPCS